MEKEIVNIRCRHCSKIYKAEKPAAGESFSTKCPYCGHEATIKLNPVDIKLNTGHASTISKIDGITPLPKYEGYYLTKKRAIVGRLYNMTCPDCGYSVVTKTGKEGIQKWVCPKCGSSVSFKAINKSGKTKVKSKKVQGASTEEHGKVVNESSQNSADSDNVPHTERVGKGSQLNLGELEWHGSSGLGKFFKKRKNLRLGSIVIGRRDKDTPSDIQLDDKYVSRRSAQLDVIPDANKGYLFKFTVLHATNPIYVNSVELKDSQSIYLAYNDIIKMGQTTLTFKKTNGK